MLKFGESTDNPVIGGNSPVSPYGLSPATSAAPTDSVASMQGHQDGASENYGYKPLAGRADRLSANIVGR